MRWPKEFPRAEHRDQLEDYAQRKGEALEITERWLASNLAYEPMEFRVKC